jgi:hypothetical protein
MQLGDRRWSASNSTRVKETLIESASLSIYPVPAHDQLTMRFSTDRDGMVSAEMYSISGQRMALVLNDRYPAGDHEYTWNMDGRFEPGMYVLQVRAGATTSVTKIIIK